MFAKIFAQIFDSSIADDPELRHFFMDLLVLCDPNGVVDMTPSAIAARTRLKLDDVKVWLSKLESPDPESRTPDHDGRRIAKLDEHRTWGWLIVNYQRFRMTASEDQRREKTRERVHRFRIGNADVTLGNADVTLGNADVTLGNACNAMQKKKKKKKQEDIGQGELAPTSKVSDEDWLDSLKTNPAYAGLDVAREHGRMVAWCSTNGKQPTRRRFINWLNRCDRPMEATAATSQGEPENFQDYLRSIEQ